MAFLPFRCYLVPEDESYLVRTGLGGGAGAGAAQDGHARRHRCALVLLRRRVPTTLEIKMFIFRSFSRNRTRASYVLLSIIPMRDLIVVY